MQIEGIPITSASIINCYRRYYPQFWNQVSSQNLFHYLNLWGIRVSTCDTSLPDDMVGGIRVNNLNFYEVLVSSASTDPSPALIANPLADARRLGGAAFVKEGQYSYRYIGTKHPTWKPHPAFCPTAPMTVYRWMPTAEEIAAWRKQKKPLSTAFEEAVKAGKVKISKSPDTCIHRAWSTTKFYNDSAGCQILSDYKTLNELGNWAKSHIDKKYGNVFMYTLFTKQQFIDANKVTVFSQTPVSSKPQQGSGNFIEEILKRIKK